MKIVIVLPVYNEEKSIPALLERIRRTMTPASLPYSIVLVDDGSTDGSLRAAQFFARTVPLKIIRHHKNEGLGRAIRDGLRAAIQASSEKDIVVTMDADNSQPPELIPEMVWRLRLGADIVIASRYATGSKSLHVPAYRRLISWAGNIAFRCRIRARRVRDYTCGFRAYRAPILRKGFQAYRDELVSSPGFECMAEILIKLCRLGARVVEIPFILDYGAKPGLSKMRLPQTLLGNMRVLAGQHQGCGNRGLLTVHRGRARTPGS
jgi:dolichol-phosphate mannosyltransferase